MREWVRAYIGLGSNLGESADTLTHAMAAIADLDAVTLVAQSSLYVSAPVDAAGPDFVNAVVQVQTRLTAPALLKALHTIESRAGRARPYRNAPRTLDLDLLLFGDARMDSAILTLPHPRMYERAFVLVPLAEISPESVASSQLEAVANQRLFPYGGA